MRRHFNRFTSGGGAGVLVGFGIWLSQGGIYRLDPTPASYWVGIGFMVLGALVGVYGWFRGGKTTETDNITILDKIKEDLITLNSWEREEAIKKAKTPCSKEKATKIHDDFVLNFGGDTISVILSILQEVAQRRSTDPLIDFFKKLSDILDSDSYGLKEGLEGNNPYKTTRTHLAQIRLKLKMGKEKKITIQKNIDRVRVLSYGLSSSVLLRSVLALIPQKAKIDIISVVKSTLEGIETAMEVTLNVMLNDLENEWVISPDTIRSLESLIPMLSLIGELLKYE